MNKRNIKKPLQIRVIKNLEYKNQIEQEGNQRGEEILKSLNTALKNEINSDYYSSLLLKYKLFS